jgi:hypothetical protein
MDLIKRQSTALSYPKEMADAIAELKEQGFICSEPALKTCEKRNHKPDAYGKTGWMFRAIDSQGRRFPWDIWVFPDGTFDGELVQAVEAEVLDPIQDEDVSKTQVSFVIFDDVIAEAIDVQVTTEPLALSAATKPCL